MDGYDSQYERQELPFRRMPIPSATSCDASVGVAWRCRIISALAFVSGQRIASLPVLNQRPMREAGETNMVFVPSSLTRTTIAVVQGCPATTPTEPCTAYDARV